ncbi:AAA family ATPase [Desulfohalovibrio reitneri]|uniref:AAA family ATPase n=1 Tax=Desulfohalovibrio reitneri TaxID=1307759 RepID=UPI0004A6ED43|nr:AAA family ATPase [Desulfohalovibrio reitneri]
MQTAPTFLPATLWLLAAALTVTVLLLFFFMHIYWRRRQQAFLQDGSEAADLAARKQQYEADAQELREWMNRQKDELLRLTSEREEQERIRAELTDLEQRCLAKDQENETLRKEVGELESQKLMASQTLEQLKRDIGSIENNRAEAEALKKEIGEMEKRLEETREILSQVPEAELRLQALNQEKTALEERIGKLHEESRELQNVEQELEELKEGRREKAQLAVLVDSLRSEQSALERDVRTLEKKTKEQEDNLEDLKEAVARETQAAEENKQAADEAREQLKKAASKREETEETVHSLEARKAVLEERIDALSRKETENGSPKAEKRYADLLKRNADCLIPDEFKSEPRNVDEYPALEQFKDDLRQRNLHFPPRLIDAFHTSLKCQSINPLTVLAGVSGTGKTLLPMKYAELMGLHSLVLPVQPRWDSPQDLFGFYNYLEKEYKATELSRALVRMDSYNYPEGQEQDGYIWPRKRMLMVLLDEMNLARTEYYFSEFLSKLELRRLVENPENPAQREKAEVELDTGPGLKKSYRIWVPKNVLFVGTMNEDETTQTLSDKVLDRSNVLRFGKPDERQIGQRNKQDQQKRQVLDIENWEKWLRKPNQHDPWQEQINSWISKINNGLNLIGRPFGFRVEDAIRLYVANYPRVDAEDRFKLAFADQVEQKIIPKLRGLDMHDSNSNTPQCINEIGNVIEELGDKPLSDAFMAAKNESNSMGMFTWHGVTRTLDQG